MLMFISKRLTSIESFASWIAATWALVLINPSDYFARYSVLFSHISSIVDERTLTFLAASYFIFTVVLFESQYCRVVSLIHFTVFSLVAYLFLHADPNGQVGFAYALLAIFNLLKWFSQSKKYDNV